MRLIDFAKRRPDGLIDQDWVEGFEAYKLQKPPESCPYDDASDQFNTWIEGWMEAAYSGNFAQDMQDFQFAGQEPSLRAFQFKLHTGDTEKAVRSLRKAEPCVLDALRLMR